MQATTTLRDYSDDLKVDTGKLLKAISSWLTRLFGCWHMEMSRPFTHGGETHRVCMGCGARRQFDVKSWEMVGAYYYDSPSKGAARVIEINAKKRTVPVEFLRSAA
ncbi:MAG: hypothetical protein WCB68_21285 [Pyrinomonadaceae bacterium]